MKIHHSAYAIVLLFVLLASFSVSVASEQILLDPTAKPPEPASTLSAIIAEAATSRRCAVRLVPNGRFILARPCALEARLGQVQRWRMSADTITLDDAGGAPLLQFRRTGARAFRTASGTPDQLVLTILPQSATPLAQP